MKLEAGATEGRAPRVFMSYRRTDDGHFVGRLHDRLLERFGEENVFRDIESLHPGINFADVIRNEIATNVDVMIAIVGPTWAGRLFDPEDFVRMELREAAAHGKPLIPVRIDETPLPAASELPDDLQFLPLLNFATVRRDPDFRRDVNHLLDGIERAHEDWLRSQSASASSVSLQDSGGHADPLTGLDDAASFVRRLGEALSIAGSTVHAVMAVNVRALRSINDAFGRMAGDELLRGIAGVLREGDGGPIVARLGGGEFAVALIGLDPPATAREAAESVQLRIRQMVVANRLPFAVRLSIGIATTAYSDSGTAAGDGTGLEAEDLLRRAERILEGARRQRLDIEIDNERSTHPVSRRRMTLDAALEQGLEQGEFELAYLPIIDTGTRAVVGIEALARWVRPGDGEVPPNEFIPLLTDSGLITRFTGWAINRALEGLASWRHEAPRIHVSVNISPRDLAAPGFTDLVASALARWDISPRALTLELPDYELIDDAALDTMHSLRRLGIGLALDDFGSGYHSLAVLSRLPVTELCLDRSFVMKLDGSSLATEALVASTIDLAHALGVYVRVKGVETAETMDYLLRMGCDRLAGFLISAPVIRDQVLPTIEAIDSAS